MFYKSYKSEKLYLFFISVFGLVTRDIS